MIRFGCCTISIAAPPMPHITVGMPGSTQWALASHSPLTSPFKPYFAANSAVIRLPSSVYFGSIGMKNGAPSRSCWIIPQTPSRFGGASAARATPASVTAATTVAAATRNPRAIAGGIDLEAARNSLTLRTLAPPLTAETTVSSASIRKSRVRAKDRYFARGARTVPSRSGWPAIGTRCG